MDPQKSSNSQTPGDDSQNAGASDAPTATDLASLSQEAANTEMPARPLAGQRIEPQTSARSDSAAATPTQDGTSGADTSQQSSQGPAASANPQAMPQSEPGAPVRSRKKGWLIGLVIAIVVLLLSGGAAAAYFGYYLPNKPENVLLRALANAVDPEKTKTVQFSGSLGMTTADSDTEFSGSYSGTASLESRAFDVSAEIDAVVTKLTLDARSVDGESIFLKIGGLDGMAGLLSGSSNIAVGEPDPNPYASLITQLNDQWFEINESVVNEAIGDAAPSRELSDMGRDKLVTSYHGNKFLVIKETLPEQDIKGVASYHYKVGVDKAKLKSFFATFKDSDVEELKLTGDQLNSINKTIDSTNFDEYGVEVWVAKGDKTFRQFAFTHEDGGNKYTVRLTIDSYNKSVEVEEPTGAKSILELLGGLLDGGLGTNLTMPALGGETQTGISL